MFDVIVETPNKTRRQVRCLGSECGIGRGDENLIVLQGWDIGRTHAVLRLQDDRIFLHKQNGRARIMVNDESVRDEYGPLCDADTVTIGAYRLQVVDGSSSASRDAACDAEFPPVQPHKRAPAAKANGKHVDGTGIVVSPMASATAEMIHWRQQVHKALVRQMDLRRVDVRGMSAVELRQKTAALIREIISEKFSARLPAMVDCNRLAKDVLDEAIGLGPLEDLLADESVTEIMVNRADEIFIERAGRIMHSDVIFTGDEALLAVIERIVTPLGRRIDESSPLVDARLPDGSRVNAVIPPVALRGPSITIRKFASRKLSGDDLLEFGSVDQGMLDFLEVAVREKKNIIVSGGTGSGKTTLLNILSNFVPDDERIVTIEDAAELKLSQPNLVSMEARPANVEGKGRITIRDLVRNALRMRPDRIVVGECRGGEALDMLQAMNTGHEGSLTTLHANSPRDVLSRLEVMVMMSDMDLPLMVVREQIASAVDMIVHQRRFPCGSRRITHITEITGIESGTIQTQPLFTFKVHDMRGPNGKVRGTFAPTGTVPEFYEDLASRGVGVDLSIFKDSARGER
ncbi:MAG TPA: ATPase, T2SS/T4P/T4SS family [Rhodanobacteraceae bacterium]